MYYAPRGYLLDFNDSKLLELFTNELKRYVKKSKGIFIKIDPYIPYKHRDIN